VAAIGLSATSPVYSFSLQLAPPYRYSTQQAEQILNVYLCVSEDLAQQSSTHVLSGMDRHGNDPAVRMTQPNMATALPDSDETGPL